jgi:hypothetical protein
MQAYENANGSLGSKGRGSSGEADFKLSERSSKGSHGGSIFNSKKSKGRASDPAPDNFSFSHTNMEDITGLLSSPAKITGQRNDMPATPPFAMTRTTNWSVGREDGHGVEQDLERRSVRDELRPGLTVDSKAARLLGMGGGSNKRRMTPTARSARLGEDSQEFDADDFV